MIENHTSTPTLWLRGAQVGLGAFRRDLVRTYWEWEQDPRALIGYGRQTPESLESRTEGIEHQLRNLDQQARFTVYDLANDEPAPIGTTALRIDHYVRTAELVLLLGPSGRGRGLAAEATLLTADYGFRITQLRSIWLKVLERNVAGIRAYESAGFQHAGRLRRSGYWLGDECDELLMDVLPADLTQSSLIAKTVLGSMPTDET